MIPEDVFLKIVRSAVKSPSVYNIQPWLFSKEKESIVIRPDFRRVLSVADPENSALFISLGCAAETAIIAAGFYGYHAELDRVYLKEQGKIRINLSKKVKKTPPELFAFINTRQTTRNQFDNRQISEFVYEELNKYTENQDIDIRFFCSQEKVNGFLPYISEASAIQFSNHSFRNELIQWLRFSQKEAMIKGDGLYPEYFGTTSLGRTFGSFIFKHLVTSGVEEKRILKQVNKTISLALLSSKQDSFYDWIMTGLNFQRFILTCTSLGLSYSHFNQPCQIKQVREKMRRDMSLDGFPQLLIRLGYAQKMQFSFRRRINDVILR